MSCHKIKYRTMGEAKSAATLLKLTGRPKAGKKFRNSSVGKNPRAYFCSLCNSFHVGNSSKKPKRDIE